MKLWLIRLLRRVLVWLEGPPIAPQRSPLELAAKVLVRQANLLPGEPSGEYKRHVVLAQLQKQFPDACGRQCSRAIEDGLDELP